MPVKMRKVKARAHRITDASVAAYKTALKGDEKRWACISDNVCTSTDPGRHCPECLENIEAHNALFRELGLPPWHISPIDPDLDGPPPRWMRGSPSAATWKAAQELRRQLEEASR
jgi:hypothetical protein